MDGLPDDLKTALFSVKLLGKFKALPPSHQREYLKWINESKTSATREARVIKTCQLLLKK